MQGSPLLGKRIKKKFNTRLLLAEKTAVTLKRRIVASWNKSSGENVSFFNNEKNF